MIGEILPSGVLSEHVFDDVPFPLLFPEEAALVERAVPKRRGEFAAARTCARRALTRLGVAPVPVLAGPRGDPRWPAGVVGSMTHCAGYRAAAVVRAEHVLALGLDAEPNEPLPDGVLRLISGPAERAALDRLPAGPVCWDRLLFSAKESVFKAWFPVTRRELTFREALVTFAPRRGTFTARLLVDSGPFGEHVRGRWLCRDGLLLTSVAVPAGAEPGGG